MLSPERGECFMNLSQDFLICTTVHKARHLAIYNGEIYVRVVLEKMAKSTKCFSNSENPYYNEYFVFELKCTLTELLRLTIMYEVKKRTTCKKNVLISELLIDLQSVWNQSNHCFFKKWGRLETPIGADTVKGEQGRGYLQIDLAIVSQATDVNMLMRPYHNDMQSMNDWHLNHDYDDIEKHLLQNFEPGLQCNIRYNIIFYKGVFAKRTDYMIQFRFHPFKGKTNVCKATTQPVWNNMISFVWVFPSLSQTFLIQVVSHEHMQWKVIAEYELHFDDIAFNEKPAFGPTYLHLYDLSYPYQYVGRLLIEVRSECLTMNLIREIDSRTVAAVEEKRWWQEQLFTIEFLPLQGDFIHCNGSNCKITLKLAEHSSTPIECHLRTYPKSTTSLIRLFRLESPFKTIFIKCPVADHRLKFDTDYFIHEILENMKTEVETFKIFQLKYVNQFPLHAKCLKAIIMSIQSKIRNGITEKRLQMHGFKDATPWDENRLAYLLEVFSKLPTDLEMLCTRLKGITTMSVLEGLIEETLQDLARRSNELTTLLAKARLQDEWPDVILVLACASKEFAVCRLNAKYFVNAPKSSFPHANSSLCWSMKNFIFKDINCSHTCAHCGCIMGIVQGCLGIVADSERGQFLDSIAKDWKQSENLSWMPTVPNTNFKCRTYIHQAKIRPGSDKTGLCDAHVRVFVGDQSGVTHVEKATLSPLWDTVLTFDGICLAGNLEWYLRNPPLLAIEFFDSDVLKSDDYLGCGLLTVSVTTTDYVDALAREEPDAMLHDGTLGNFGQFVKTRTALAKFHQLKNLSPPSLKWVTVATKGIVHAEVLLSAELIEQRDTFDKVPSMEPAISFGIPKSIRPTMKNYVMEVVFGGFRNYNKARINARHCIKVMMGELLLSSGLSMKPIKNSINFLVLYASGVVSLPEQLEYWPAIVATDVAVSARGTETTIGAVLIPNSKRFLQRHHKIVCESNNLEGFDTSMPSTTVQIHEFDDEEDTTPLLHNAKRNIVAYVTNKMKPSNKNIIDRVLPLNMSDAMDIINENEFNWWTKFYNSLFLELHPQVITFKHRLTIFTNELEKQAEYSFMHDWAEPLGLVHGFKYKKKGIPIEDIYTTLKLHIKLTPCNCGISGDTNDSILTQLAALNPRYQEQLQSLADLCQITVRVYVVQGIQLRPCDKNSQSDAYVKLQLGSKSTSNRAHYVPNQSNPIFGKCFQLEALLPREHLLEVSIFDRNRLHDNEIGSTCIDLEDRWRSKHRATVGIPHEYSSNGYNKWRDVMSPFDILLDLCAKYDVQTPTFLNNTIQIDGIILGDEAKISTNEDIKERLSLTALRNLHKVPAFGFKLIPEHVETRSLYRSDCPGIEQGKIQLWVELFEGTSNLPLPIDITPQPPQIYELRVIIYNCMDVLMDETNIFGKPMSDIFIKGWCTDANDAQFTDIHYRSLTGEANFNWRMVFTLKYSAIEDMLVIKHSGILTEEYETKQPPMLYLQLWDNDFISVDDFLGSLEINLSNFPQPYDSHKQCALPDDDDTMSLFHLPNFLNGNTAQTHRKPMNLFRQKRIRGWFAIRGRPHRDRNKTNHTTAVAKPSLAGKVELELQVLTEVEAASDPVGLGRSPPQPLPKPKRPDTSFNPLTHPIKAFTKIFWPGIRKYVLFGVLILFLVVIVFVSIGNVPKTFVGL